MTPGAAEALATLAGHVGQVFDMGRRQQSHIWPDREHKSLCGLELPRAFTPPLFHPTAHLEAGKVCRKCLRGLKHRFHRRTDDDRIRQAGTA